MKFLFTEQEEKFFFRSKNPEKPLSRLEITLLKAIQDEKKEYKTKAELLIRISDLLMALNISTSLSKYFYELYTLNYRKKGDYENITKSDYVDPRFSKGKTTPNTAAYQYAHALLPFKGSNMSGSWARDLKGEQIYIIKSYDWYPIYVYRNGVWYEVSKRYSPSTGRHMYNVDPFITRKDEKLNANVYFLSPDEMKDVLRGKSHDEIMEKKKQDLLKSKEQFINKRASRLKTYGGDEWHGGSVSVKFKVNDIIKENNRIIIFVDIIDVISKRNPEKNYLRGEMPGIDKKFVEKRVSQNIKEKFKEYVGKKIGWYDEDYSGANFDMKFNHLKTS